MFIPNFLNRSGSVNKTNSLMALKLRFAEKAGATSPRATVNAQREYFMLRSQLESQEELKLKTSTSTESIKDAVHVA